MWPLIAFVTAVSLTVVLLIAVVITGVRGKISVHIPCVLATFVALGTAIWFALQLGKIYDLPAAGVITPIHLTLAKVATAAYLAPVITGIRTLKSSSHRRAHLIAAMIALFLTATALVTGTLMLMWAPKIG